MAEACRGREFDPWVGKISWRRKWQPTPVFLPKSLASYRPGPITCLPVPRAAPLRCRANCPSVLPPPSHRCGLKQPQVRHATGWGQTGGPLWAPRFWCSEPGIQPDLALNAPSHRRLLPSVGRSRPGLMWPRASLASGFRTGQPQGLPEQQLPGVHLCLPTAYKALWPGAAWSGDGRFVT